MNDLLLRQVSKTDMVHTDLAIFDCKLGRAGSVGTFRLFFQQQEDAFGRCQCRLQFAEDVCNLIDRAGKFAGIEDKGRKIAQRQCKPPSEQIEHCTENRDQRKGKVVDEVDRRAHSGRSIVRLIIGVTAFGVAGREAAVHCLFLMVGFNGFVTGD